MAANPNRSVTALTPLLFAPAAGAISALAAKYGLDIDGDALAGIFATGAVIAFGKSGMWMKGWQQHEAREAAQREEIDMPVAEEDEAEVVESGLAPDDLPAADDEFDDEFAAFSAGEG